MPLSDETIKICKDSDAVLLGAVGGTKWDKIEPELRPEKGLFKNKKRIRSFYKPKTSYSF